MLREEKTLAWQADAVLGMLFFAHPAEPRGCTRAAGSHTNGTAEGAAPGSARSEELRCLTRGPLGLASKQRLQRRNSRDLAFEAKAEDGS